jgi:long-chain acyl-CoA synthetase
VHLSRDAILRLLRALITDDLARSGIAPPATLPAPWPETLGLGKPAPVVSSSPETPAIPSTPSTPYLDIDSVALLSLASRVSRFFHLHESGIDDSLLMHCTLGQWADIVILGRQDPECSGRLTFSTSGSTGTPRKVAHDPITLDAEVAAIDAYLTAHNLRPSRIVSAVPAHHLYGFIWSVLLPEHLSIPLIELPAATPGAVARILRPGDLLISHPAWLASVGCNLPSLAGITVASSAGSLGHATASELASLSPAAILDIYGSTETGGIAIRRFPAADHELLSCWNPGPTAQQLTRIVTGQPHDVQDELTWPAPSCLRIGRRLDGAVKVGGINVYPDHIAKVIGEHPAVAACTVRLHDAPGLEPGARRLKAFIVPAGNTPDSELSTLAASAESLRRELETFIASRLSAAERPTRLDFGPALPRGPLGKLTDW